MMYDQICLTDDPDIVKLTDGYLTIKVRIDPLHKECRMCGKPTPYVCDYYNVYLCSLRCILKHHQVECERVY